jgi:RNA ligase (TIGR02306 family)
MAFFGVTIETVKSVMKHENSDHLYIVKLNGLDFQFVTAVNTYQQGDHLLYFPIDSIFPLELMKQLDLIKKDDQGEYLFDEQGKPCSILSGPGKNRIKTVKLRGEISQGLVSPLDLLDNYFTNEQIYDENRNVNLSTEEITNKLGVTKYEPSEIFEAGAKLLPLPCGLKTYDIEGADRMVSTLDELLDLHVNITEKVEGRNFSLTYDQAEDKFYVNQRNFTIIPDDEETNTYWKTANKYKLKELAKLILEILQEMQIAEDKETITIYGELIGPGIQGNIYKIKDYQIKLFDIKTSNFYFNPTGIKLILDKAMDKIDGFNKDIWVPVLANDVILRVWLDGQSIKDASNGKSALYPSTLREGIVIRPMIESYSRSLRSRLILKQRSPQYLAKTEN